MASVYCPNPPENNLLCSTLSSAIDVQDDDRDYHDGTGIKWPVSLKHRSPTSNGTARFGTTEPRDLDMDYGQFYSEEAYDIYERSLNPSIGSKSKYLRHCDPYEVLHAPTYTSSFSTWRQSPFSYQYENARTELLSPTLDLSFSHRLFESPSLSSISSLSNESISSSSGSYESTSLSPTSDLLSRSFSSSNDYLWDSGEYDNLLPDPIDLEDRQSTPPLPDSGHHEDAQQTGPANGPENDSMEINNDTVDQETTQTPLPTILNSSDSHGIGKTADDIDIEDKSLPYAQLIYMALMSAPSHKMVLSEIYHYFRREIPRFRKAKGKGWMNSIRHNLSMNGAFLKEDRPPGDTGKGYIWVLSAEAIRDGVKSTTRFRKTPPCSRKKNFPFIETCHAYETFKPKPVSTKSACSTKVTAQERDICSTSQYTSPCSPQYLPSSSSSPSCTTTATTPAARKRRNRKWSSSKQRSKRTGRDAVLSTLYTSSSVSSAPTTISTSCTTTTTCSPYTYSKRHIDTDTDYDIDDLGFDLDEDSQKEILPLLPFTHATSNPLSSTITDASYLSTITNTPTPPITTFNPSLPSAPTPAPTTTTLKSSPLLSPLPYQLYAHPLDPTLISPYSSSSYQSSSSSTATIFYPYNPTLYPDPSGSSSMIDDAGLSLDLGPDVDGELNIKDSFIEQFALVTAAASAAAAAAGAGLGVGGR